jgi:Adenylate and Guanylate cyclase catalytic domain
MQCRYFKVAISAQILVLDHPASRIESSGVRERIHLSEQTALELIKQGKQDWVTPREDVIEAKGKGRLNTYWLKLNSERLVDSMGPGSSDWSESESSEHSMERAEFSNAEMTIERLSSSQGKLTKERRGAASNKRNQRLVDWNSGLLLQLLKQVVADRQLAESDDASSPVNLDDIAHDAGQRGMVVDEVSNAIPMPSRAMKIETITAELSDAVTTQLRSYVTQICYMYNENPCKLAIQKCVNVACTRHLRSVTLATHSSQL